MSEESTEVTKWIGVLKYMPDQVRKAIAAAEDTAELVDVLGTVHSVTAIISGIKRRAASEVESGDAGRRWYLQRGRVAKRTYNDMSLILKFQQAWKHKSATMTIGELIDEGVLELKWNWTPLDKLISEYEMTLSSVTGRSVTSGDDYDVGIEWGNKSPSYVALDET